MTKTAAANAESCKGGVRLRWGVETQGEERRIRLCENVRQKKRRRRRVMRWRRKRLGKRRSLREREGGWAREDGKGGGESKGVFLCQSWSAVSCSAASCSASECWPDNHSNSTIPRQQGALFLAAQVHVSLKWVINGFKLTKQLDRAASVRLCHTLFFHYRN